MRLARNVFYVSGAIIGVGMLLYFAAGVASILYLGGFHVGQNSLPGPISLAWGSTYSVTPDCPMTAMAFGGRSPDRPAAEIRSRIMSRDFVRFYGISDSVSCTTPSGRIIEAVLKSIDDDGVHFSFEWSH